MAGKNPSKTNLSVGKPATLSAAIAAQGPGIGTTSIPDSFVSLTMQEKNEDIVIEIEDNGLGIQDKIQSKVFEMFYRGHAKSEGSGLGLYIVKETISKLNGDLKVESQPGVGTTFQLNIPNLKNN